MVEHTYKPPDVLPKTLKMTCDECGVSKTVKPYTEEFMTLADIFDIDVSTPTYHICQRCVKENSNE